ncbi:putative gustatory receptor 28b [Microplitis demolitor]|uniref:putative gustatory receptor 28b n=1 Tax=Microplitis demolitor TaxID=69319 RepID=UPI0004CDC2DD|nr:putative gustatory receptor 28b [Microplitis demolitor]
MTLLLRVSPDFIGGWVIVQYTISLKIIDRRFKSINSTITKLGTITNDRNGVKTLPETQISLSHEIESIKYAYIELCEMCDDIAEFYGLPVLISIIHYVTINIIRFVTATIKQSKKTVKLTNSLLNKYAVDKETEKQLTKFSSDILHSKVEFTACDIIPLDLTLLSMITGTIASYLVIVVQFRINSPSN